MLISAINVLFSNNKKTVCNNRLKSDLSLSRPLQNDTIVFTSRTYTNRDPETQLYRAIGFPEIKALCNGEIIGGTSYATSDPKGWRACDWGKGHKSQYFITFDKNRIEFSDHRDFDEDTRYLVEPYNLADVKEIRKGNHAHGEIIYSSDFEDGIKKDIENKKQDIIKTIEKLKSDKLDFDEGIKLTQNLKSYSDEFPEVERLVKKVLCGTRKKLYIDEDDLISKSILNENDKEAVELLKCITPDKIDEYKIKSINDILEKYNCIVNE